jgi:2-dehydropantoate 2-reductase
VIRPHWHVLGAGAIGCLFATNLQRSGLPVTLLLREQHGEVPVLVEEGDRQRQLYFPTSGPGDAGYIGHLLVTTKAYDVCPAVTSVAHRLDQNSQVLLLANGLGYSHELRRALPTIDYYLGSTTEGAYRLAPLHIHHAGRGYTRIGKPGCSSPPDWFESWSRAVHPGSWDEDILGTLWLKLAINCAINPLTALHRCRNGELARPPLAAQVLSLCAEIAPVCTAAGFPITPAALHQQVCEVIAATAANRSSMLQDVLAGRPTECNYITGYLLATARQHGIDAPRNDELLTRMRKLES